MPHLVVALFAVFPISLGQFNPVLPPAISQNGQAVACGAIVAPDGTPQNAADVWLWTAPNAALLRLTNYGAAAAPAGVTAVALSPDGAQLAYTAYFSNPYAEEVHLIDTATGQDRLLVSDKQGCVQPLLACPSINCYLPCLHQPQVTQDGRVLYTASRMQPFFVVNAAGALTELPIYSGALAGGPQRAISSNGQVVFVSSAPAGPTFAAAPADVYLMNLDGSALRNLTHFSNINTSTQNAVISADGQTIAFESNANAPGTSSVQIYVVRADGSGLRQLTTGPDPASTPSLSADGSLVAFVQSGQIHPLATSGASAPAGLTNLRYSTARDPVLSDDASRVAFTIGPPNGGRGAIYITPAAGGPATPVYAPVSLNPGGVFGVAGNEPPSPGALISLYGLNFSNDAMVVAGTFPLPPELAGISLLVNGQPVPLSSVTPWQINAQLPQQTPVGDATLQVRFAGAPGNTVTAQIVPTAPAVFAYPAPGPQPDTTYWQAAAFHPGTAIAADAAHPAAAGETLETYGSGLGATNPPVAAGVPSPVSPPAAAPAPQVAIGGQPVHVTFAGLVPGLAGVYQINAVVPAGLASGQQSLIWTYDNRGASIFVQ